MGVLENVANHLWKYKQERGLSVDALAAELNMGRTTVYKCLRKQWNPSLSSLAYLSEQLGMPLETLLLPPSSEQARQEDTREYLLQLKRILEDV